MKIIHISYTAILILAVGLIIAGCSGDDGGSVSESEQTVSLKSITPSDGASAVPPSTNIHMTFTGPVDTMSVMRNFYLAGGQPMHMWRDSLNHHGGFGMMNMSMQNHMMNWMDSIHTRGEFHWNQNRDSCEFVPDSSLMAGADYLCLLYAGGMQGHGGGMMGMMGNRDGEDAYHMFEFTTRE